ncbi:MULTISPECIES: hypothetical protein [Sphingomonadaceae]|jgi:hypothetical protein|uniref:Lipocalin-like domain-containing protein n=3 Tax=Sphingomonadaceae TaxID=41297 RepID=A0A401J2H3_SPHXE|nr:MULTISPECIES: hypothetical protein [Sphingomonadaceae]QTH25019.1 hypothetical protein HRJ34_28660 [Rhizorhabdus wittichii]RJG52125.1 hypothetical protein D0Z70_21605 [Sphingobium terrigena]GBH30842.1 hypothetical protein MBESOW_P2097 [Sphingobium xenophagum]|tara:strand:- start:60 stop:524 length:465 start_codon:yes stop_codon:yes gene_type:complete
MRPVLQRLGLLLLWASRRQARALLSRASLALAVIAAVGGLAQPSVAEHLPGQHLGSKTDLIGIWSFDARSGCKTGTAWEFRADGSYNEISLPDRAPQATGTWYERGDIIFYSLARPETVAPGRPDKRMVIIEREPDRLVALGGRRVRHVMHRCP